MTIKKIKRDSNHDLMVAIHTLIEQDENYNQIKNILDYFSLEKYNLVDITNYQFDFIAKLIQGSSEGIYIDCFISCYIDNTGITKSLDCGTYKTLGSDKESYLLMGQLVGLLTYYSSVYVNKKLR